MSILAKILADKVQEVAKARVERPLATIEAEARQQSDSRCLATALRRNAGEPLRVIAEFKRASPSAGAIKKGAKPEVVSAQYQEAGASAISVLTDETYFDGHLSFLARVRQSVALPVLRKDFVIDSYQVVEARAAGADAILLIVAALDDAQLGDLYQCARDYGMRVLVEVHDEAEADRALRVGCEIIGVNHRNLATFDVDLSLTGRLASRLRDHKELILVGESGIRNQTDMQQMSNDGAHAVLVGESLMRAEHPGQALRQLRGVV